MDLIYTNSSGIDQGVLLTYALDLSFGASENDFELTLEKNDTRLEDGAFLYYEGHEYGGIIDGRKTATNGSTITYLGRTWHGIINSKVIAPDLGADYYIVSGALDSVLTSILARIGLSSLFVVDGGEDITIAKYQFPRFVKAYDGILKMLSSFGYKLKMEWKNRQIHLSAVPIVDYTKEPIDGDTADLTIEKHTNKVNHLICLGKGELSERTVLNLYYNKFGEISTYDDYGEFQGIDAINEICEIYENTSTEEEAAEGDESTESPLMKAGKEKFLELRNTDKITTELIEGTSNAYDIGDIVGGIDNETGISATAVVTQKILKINNGVLSVSYKIGDENNG